MREKRERRERERRDRDERERETREREKGKRGIRETERRDRERRADQRLRSHLGSSNGSFAPSPSCSKRLLLVLAVCHSMGPTYVTRAEFLDALRQQRDHFDQALRAVTAEQEQMHQLIVSVDIVADQAMRAAGRLASPTRPKPSYLN